jgi:tetratricopeptide (TPR) repeat protein
MQRIARLTLFLGGTLAGLLCVYWRVRGYGLLDIDDPLYVMDPHVAAPLTASNLVWLLTHPIAFNWTPFSWYSHMLDHALFGANLGVHHLSGVVYHALAATALVAFLDRATGRPWRSIAVGLLFAFHPLRVESVAWLVERKDTLSGLFGALALLAYTAYARRPRAGSYALTWLLFVCAILSKSMLVTLPCLMLLVDYWPLARHQPLTAAEPRVTLRRLLLEKLPFLPPSVFVAYMAREGVGYTDAADAPLSPAQRLLNAVYSLAQYVRKTLLPSDLSFCYPHPYLPSTGGRGLDAATIALCALLMALLALLCFINLRKRPYLFVGFSWFAVALAPVLGVYFQAGRQGMADRFSYFPSVGLCILVVWAVADGLAALSLRPARAAWATFALLGCVVIGLALRSRVEVERWRNAETLYVDALAKNPLNTQLHYLLGRLLIDRGESQRGLTHLVRAATLTPTWEDLVTGAANALRTAGRIEDALALYRSAYGVAPQYNHTRINLAAALAATGRYAEAIPLLELASHANPQSLPTRINLAAALAATGRLHEASAELDRALHLDPGSTHTLWLSARVLAALNDKVEAAERLERLLRATPDDVQAREMLAQLNTQ